MKMSKKGSRFAEQYLRGVGGMMLVSGMASAIVQQGRLNADNRLRQSRG